jgi:TonB family protein
MFKSYTISTFIHILMAIIMVVLFTRSALLRSELHSEPEKVHYRVNLRSADQENPSHIGSQVEVPPLTQTEPQPETNNPQEDPEPVEENPTQLPQQTGGEDDLTVQISGAGPEDPYVKSIVRKVGRYYQDPLAQGIPSKKVVISFTIASNGNIENITVEQSSGDDFFDLAGIRAIKNASPLPPLPERFGSSASVHFFFEHRSN